jgi:hypothetical protein
LCTVGENCRSGLAPKPGPLRRALTHRLFQWVGTRRVALRHVSSSPPLDPYVRLSPHTAHERGILRAMSISPAPRNIPRGQLYAFAGYLCTVCSTLSLGAFASGLLCPCAQLSCAQTTPPHLPPLWSIEISRDVSPLTTSHLS